jgi:glycosyltransferase involved in cell wall biosynthesis
MRNEAKTLVILTPGFPENEADSTCLPAQQAFILALKKDFPQIKIIVLSFEYPLRTIPYNWHHIQVIPFNGTHKRKLRKLAVWYRVWKKLLEIKKQETVLGLFSFWCTECALLGKYFAKWHFLKHYIWILGQDAKKDNRFIRLIRPKSEELVAMSDYLSQEFFKNHAIKPLHIIPNAIDPGQYPGGAIERKIDVLGVGSLIPLKQYDIFINVIKSLTRNLPFVDAMICGKGPESENLQSMIGKLQLESNISMPGEKEHPEILKLMQNARVFLHPSSYEGFSSVCLEALYAGAHVVSFINPMLAWIKHWHIVINEEEMVEKTLELLNDSQLDHEPVLPYSMRNTAGAIMRLFSYKEASLPLKSV